VSFIDRDSAVIADPEAERAALAVPIVRPTPHRWLWYALGGGLPERHRGWVLHDTTTGTWWLRHITRGMVQLSIPIALVMTLVPAGWGLRAAAALGGVFLAMIYSLCYMAETTENRVVKAGYPAGTAATYRDRVALVRQKRESERKRAAAAKRAARYRNRGH
jgi:drug/metabolite transporter superfamily protein YnfA